MAPLLLNVWNSVWTQKCLFVPDAGKFLEKDILLQFDFMFKKMNEWTRIRTRKSWTLSTNDINSPPELFGQNKNPNKRKGVTTHSNFPKCHFETWHLINNWYIEFVSGKHELLKIHIWKESGIPHCPSEQGAVVVEYNICLLTRGSLGYWAVSKLAPIILISYCRKDEPGTRGAR